MTAIFDSVRDYAHSHTMSVVAAGLIIVLPGTYLYITGKSIPCAVAGICSSVPSPSTSPPAGTTRGLSVYESLHPLDLRLSLPMSTWRDKPARIFVLQGVQDIRRSILALLSMVRERLGIRLDMSSIPSPVLKFLESHWAHDFLLPRLMTVAVTAALPGVFLLLTHNYPGSRAAKHQTLLANALHVLALIAVANWGVSVQDLLVTTLVIVGFGVFQRPLSQGEARSVSEASAPAIETLLSSTHNAVAQTDIVAPIAIAKNGCLYHEEANPDFLARDFAFVTKEDDAADENEDEKDREMRRLQRLLLEFKTASQNKEIDLKRTQSELKNARSTLTETFTEYSSLRDEMKNLKQTLGRDHQAVIYRKDIELFALRKANEQKENFIKDREAKLERMEVQIRDLKERVGREKEVNGDSKIEIDNEHQNAVQVKLLRIKGRSSQENDRLLEEKDLEIAQLKEDLTAISHGSATISRVQDELRRAWDTVSSTQGLLSEERHAHAQTQARLQEVLSRSQKNSPTRLPTIEESDKHELEAMFNAAQQDNLRLHAEHEALDKRLRDANARVFIAEQELEALKEQLRLEKAINEDMETARPSLVHRVHYQRMEGMLREVQEKLEASGEEVAELRSKAAAKDGEVDDVKKAKDKAEREQTKLQEQVRALKNSVSELESTKEQLMLDHERLASQRARQRHSGSSAEHTSARSSGATLITDASIHPIFTDAETPLPARPVTVAGDMSIQTTPERMVGSVGTPTPEKKGGNRHSMISNDIPPPELREKGARRKSLGLRGFVRKMTGRDAENDTHKNGEVKEDKREKEKGKNHNQERPKTALAPKDKNTMMRPKTAIVPEGALKTEKEKKVKEEARPKTAAPSKGKETERPKTAAPAKDTATPSSKTSRYYADRKGDARPKTALEEKEEREYGSKDVGAIGMAEKEKERPKSRGWMGSGSVS